MMRPLPIGIQEFRDIRSKEYLYVDKTKFLFELDQNGKYYFLSRPRRFGKSLTLSTLKELFSGNKDLFKGLWIEDKWNWEQKYPVIHISFSSIGYKTSDLETALNNMVNKQAAKHQIELTTSGHDQRFKELIEKLSVKGQVIILIDEYDKPLIDYLDNLDQAKEHQKILKAFYSVLKDSDGFIRFLMITGVSKFSKVSIFSELNNLLDLTIHPAFSTLTGYTQDELEHYFADRIESIQKEKGKDRETLLSEIKHWYNGYSWDGENFVYNPFSALSFFHTKQFQNFWFATGTPTFLINLFKERMVYDLGSVEVGQVAFDSFNIDYIDTTSLLFQTGYLTIKSVEEFGLYHLDYPNQEVKDSMLQYLIGAFSHSTPVKSTPIVLNVRRAFIDNDIEKIITIINGLFKSIPSHIFIKNKEAYYHSVVFLVFQYLGQFIQAEVHTSDGRIDALVETETHIYILEFKLNESAETALKQIQSKAYSEKYKPNNKILVGIGVNFTSEKKAVDDWKMIQL